MNMSEVSVKKKSCQTKSRLTSKFTSEGSSAADVSYRHWAKLYAEYVENECEDLTSVNGTWAKMLNYSESFITVPLFFLMKKTNKTKKNSMI